jgi:hypothetical protein
VVLLLVACVLVTHSANCHLVLRIASSAARLLAVTLMAVSIVPMPLMSAVPVSSTSVSVH